MKNLIIYDFDGTLTPFSVPKFEILEKSGLKGGAQNPLFLNVARKKANDENISFYQAIYDNYFEIIKNGNLELTDKNFCLGSKEITYNKGIFEYLEMLKKNNISNYLLSSGVKAYLEKTTIAPYFKDIYATTFTYDTNNTAIGVDFLMSDQNKVTAIKDILAKNNLSDCSSIIYIGDGFTDYYAMEFVKQNNGTSIYVYTDSNKINESMNNVINFCTEADYTNNSKLNSYVKKLCNIK